MDHLEHKGPPWHPLYLAGFSDEEIIRYDEVFDQQVMELPVPISRDEYYRMLTQIKRMKGNPWPVPVVSAADMLKWGKCASMAVYGGGVQYFGGNKKNGKKNKGLKIGSYIYRSR